MSDVPRRTVIVVGGTGAFGERLVRGLVAHSEFAVLIAARDLARAEALAALLGGGDRVAAMRFDTRDADAAMLRATRAFALVDAAGPFQGGDFALARACIEAGVHYLDLADGRDFVARFPMLDAAARAAGVVALTGVSSSPAISHAVLDAITRGWSRVDRVEIAIAPGNRAPRGVSVLRAVLSYAGRPVRVLIDGAWQMRPGWGLTRWQTIPGLGRRFLALCETPDLDLVPQRFAVRRSAIFRAGQELPILHLGLLLASLPIRLLPRASLTPLTSLFHAGTRIFARFGSDRGGMTVLAEGRDATGHPQRATWTLLAEAGDGPNVPTLPAIAALRLLALGTLPPGARAVAGEVSYAAIAAEFAPYRITTTTSVTEHRAGGVFTAALGDAFAHLPAPIRAVHEGGAWLALRGEARVEGAETWLGRVVAALIGFPRAMDQVPVRVTLAGEPGRETWTRQFGSHRFRSTLSAGRAGVEVEEIFGALRFDIRLRANEQGLTYEIIGWRIGPLPLPRALAPRSLATETVDAEGRFVFDVPIALPLIGRVVRYRGWLVEEEPGAERY